MLAAFPVYRRLWPDPFEQRLGRFVGWVLRNQFAPESLGKDCGFQPVEQRASACGLGFETICAGEGGFNSLY
jgi:hypothetical protein